MARPEDMAQPEDMARPDDIPPRAPGRVQRFIGRWYGPPLIGTAFAVLLLAATFGTSTVLGLRDHEQPGPSRTPRTDAVAAAIDVPASLPPGDYGPLCRLLVDHLGGAAKAGEPIDALMAGYRTMPMDEVLAVAPKDLRPTVVYLRDVRAQVVATYQGTELANLDASTFPPDFLAAAGVVTKIVAEKCAPPNGQG